MNDFLQEKGWEDLFVHFCKERGVDFNKKTKTISSGLMKRAGIGPDQVILLAKSAEGLAKLKEWGYVKD